MICMIHDYERNLAKTPGGGGELRYDTYRPSAWFGGIHGDIASY